jgi:hypothetical protein
MSRLAPLIGRKAAGAGIVGLHIPAKSRPLN